MEEQRNRAAVARRAGDVTGWWLALRSAGEVHELSPRRASLSDGAVEIDHLVDGGAAVFLLVDPTPIGHHERALAALLTGGDATTVMTTSRDDVTWMRDCAAVRDAMAQLRPDFHDLTQVLAADDMLAWQVGAVVRAAERHSVVVVAGVRPLLATLCAQRLDTTSSDWVACAVADRDDAGTVAAKRLGLTPWMTTTIPLPAEERTILVRTLVAGLDSARP